VVGVVTRACRRCGETFEAKGDWMKLCWQCWRRREDQRQDRAYDAGYRAGLVDGGGQRHGHGRLDDELLRVLVTLCHPDRHPPERFELANRATATLLGLIQNGGVRR
jgi:hypothetical protein